jgi:ADP-heptose:LPS heptosyltransferase
MMRIAVVRALPGLGDMLCSAPAFRALRAAHPDAHVTLVGLPSAEWFVSRFSDDVDELRSAAGCSDLPEAARWAAPEGSVGPDRYDLVLQLHGSGPASNRLAAALPALRRVVHALDGDPIAQLPGTVVVPFVDEGHEIERQLRVLGAAGVPSQGTSIGFPLDASDHAEAATALASVGVPGCAPTVAVHPGSADPTRRWSPKGFAIVAAELAASGHHVVVTGGPAEGALVKHVVREA